MAHIMARHAAGIDWSTAAQIVITPVDGVPIYRDWLDAAKQFDALLTISEFGVGRFARRASRRGCVRRAWTWASFTAWMMRRELRCAGSWAFHLMLS